MKNIVGILMEFFRIGIFKRLVEKREFSKGDWEGEKLEENLERKML